MANSRCTRYPFQCALLFLLLLQNRVLCFQYKVGNLDAWGLPTAANPHVYTDWPKKLTFKVGDSLLFLYPPSQDSVIQVTGQSFNGCNLKDPILYMSNGNSLFNISKPGEFYFTSGEPGHCEKSQKLQVSVFSGNGSAVTSADGPTSSLPATAPSYPTNFGSIPAGRPSSAPTQGIHLLVSAAAIGFVLCALVGGSM